VTVAVSARISALLEGVTIALDAIRANKVRAALTILGIAVGVFSVTAMAAMIHGINESVAKDIESAGATTFFITRWPVGFNSCDGTDELCPWRHNPGTSFAEMTAMGRLPSIEGVMGEIDFNGVFKYGDRALPSAQLTGYTPGWEQMTGGDINPGRSFTIEENASGARVVLLNDIAVKHLFADSVDPVGKSVTIDNAPFEVIGWYHYHPSFFTGGEHAMGIIPVQTLIRHYKVWVPDMWVSVKPVATVPRDQAIDDIIAYLRGARGLLRRHWRRHLDALGRWFARGRRRRHRDHDDQCHRAHPRDRRAQSARGHAAHHSVAVPDRSRHADQHRRRHRLPARMGRRGVHEVAVAEYSRLGAAARDPHCDRGEHHHRYCIRRAAGRQGLTAGPRYGPPVRIARSACGPT
jgi:hypothetical protein